MGGSRITAEDVARRAGVSRATVSYVLNNHPHQTIPDATKQKSFSGSPMPKCFWMSR